MGEGSTITITYDSITFDRFGDISKESLKAIIDAKCRSYEDAEDLIKLIGKLWFYPDAFRGGDGKYAISTGGLGSNEELFCALDRNYTFRVWAKCVCFPDGHRLYAVNDEARNELRRLSWDIVQKWGG